VRCAAVLSPAEAWPRAGLAVPPAARQFEEERITFGLRVHTRSVNDYPLPPRYLVEAFAQAVTNVVKASAWLDRVPSHALTDTRSCPRRGSCWARSTPSYAR
jgi:hypothetical protein